MSAFPGFLKLVTINRKSIVIESGTLWLLPGMAKARAKPSAFGCGFLGIVIVSYLKLSKSV